MKAPKIRTRENRQGKTVYFVDYYDENGHRHRETFGTRKSDAEKATAIIAHNRLHQKLGIPKSTGSSVALEELVEKYFRSQKNHLAYNTERSYRNCTRRLLEFFKQRFPRVEQIDKITKDYLEELMLELHGEGKTSATINTHLRVIKLLFRYAVAEDLLQISPAEKLQPYKQQRDKRMPYWKTDELKRILEAVNPGYRDHFEFLFFTGLRKAELYNLTWDDVRLGRKPEITVQGKDDFNTKTNLIRQIPLCPQAVRIVKRREKLAHPRYVFTQPDGSKIKQWTLNNVLRPLLLKLDMTGTVHQFRHSFASHMVMNGAGIEAVSKLLGHTNVATTMIYAHLSPDYLREAVNKLKL
jgi:integrase/recombinase XerD